jgi:hypothetical protein
VIPLIYVGPELPTALTSIPSTVSCALTLSRKVVTYGDKHIRKKLTHEIFIEWMLAGINMFLARLRFTKQNFVAFIVW